MSKLFPIMKGPAIPWEVIEPHGGQALHNHSQTLQRLAERGGLSPAEALATLNNEPLFPYIRKLQADGVTDAQAATMLEDYVKERWYLPRIDVLESALKERDERLQYLTQYLNDTSEGFEHIETCDSNGCDGEGGCPVSNIPEAFRILRERLKERDATVLRLEQERAIVHGMLLKIVEATVAAEREISARDRAESKARDLGLPSSGLNSPPFET